MKKLLYLLALLPTVAFTQVQPTVDNTPATLSNKNISGSTNTFTNLPASQMVGVFPTGLSTTTPGVLSGNFYLPGALMWSITDRMMVGGAALGNGQDSTFSGTPSWLSNQNYLFRDAQFGVIQTFGLWGVAIATRTSDFTGSAGKSTGAIGAYVANNGPGGSGGSGGARIIYAEELNSYNSGTAGMSIGEYAMADTSGVSNTVTPYGGSAFGTAGDGYNCGESSAGAIATTNCNYAIRITGKNSGSTVQFNKGIVFDNAALNGSTGSSGNTAQAIEMGYGQGVRWYSSNGSVQAGRISSIGTASVDQSHDMQFINNGVQWVNGAVGTNTFAIAHVASGENSVKISDAVNGAGPLIAPVSGDSETVLPLNLAGLGGAAVATTSPLSVVNTATVNAITFPTSLSAGGIFNAGGGIKLPGAPTQITDTTSTGTITSTYSYRMSGDTYLASNATTLTNLYALDIEAPTCSTNVTCPTIGSLRLGSLLQANGLITAAGGLTATGALNVNVSGTSSSAVNLNTASGQSGAITIGNSSNTGKTVLAGLAASSAAQTGTVCIGTGNILSYDTTTTCLLSDMRLKMNPETLDIGLETVMKFHPISYDLRPEVNPTHLGRQVGLSAQDVYAIDPRLAALYQSGPNAGTPSGVRYEQMTAVLIHAIQQQQHEIDDLKRQLKHRSH